MQWFLFFLPFCALFAELKTVAIILGENTLSVEIAETKKDRDKGLMGRSHLPEGKGMLFVYQKPQHMTFWMKNTLIPLSIGFFDEKQILIGIADMDPLYGRAKSPTPALYALEVPQGWFAKHRISVGEKFSFSVE